VQDLLNTRVCYQQWWKGAPLLTPVLEWHLFIAAALVGAISIQIRAAVTGGRPRRQRMATKPAGSKTAKPVKTSKQALKKKT
jgi:hypothetical protein